MTCAKCGRDNCRVAYWQDLWDRNVGTTPTVPTKGMHYGRETIERALSAARVSCFIRTRATQARAQRDD